MSLVLDSGGISALAERSQRAAALIVALRREGLWPPTVPTPVLIETLRGDPREDAVTNRFLKTCHVIGLIPESIARQAAKLRCSTQTGSAVDALVVAMAEPHGAVLTGDEKDLEALATHSRSVRVVGV